MNTDLEALKRHTERQKNDLATLDALVCRARYNGATWPSIAAVLGVSPQAVQQRYGPRMVHYLPLIDGQRSIDD